MRQKNESAGHAIAKGNEREREKNNAQKALALAKVQEAQKKGRYNWDEKRRAYFLMIN